MLTLWRPTPTAQAQNPASSQAFVLLSSDNAQVMAPAQAAIQTGGGQIIHAFPNQALIINIADDTLEQLAHLPGVAGAFTQPVELAQMDIYGPKARQLAEVWNNLVAPQSPPAEVNALAAAGHPDDHNDTFLASDLPAADGLGVAAASSVTPGYYQTSDYMAGSVAVGIVLVESNGVTDPSTENWTESEKQLVFSEIVAALNWWAQLEPRANLSFVYDDHFSTPLPTNVEPITRPYYHQQYWIADAMAALGYTASSYFTRVRDYNNALRTAYQTDWAFTIFVVDSSADADNRFSDSYFAYAYLGGPFTVMTYGNNGYGPYNMDAVAAHEIGHIFFALDQYYSAYQNCTRRSGYLNVENQNSQYGGCASNVASIMRGQTSPYWANAIDTYAAGQIGWRDSDTDNILDPLDTSLPVTISSQSQNGNSVTINGTANIIPYPSPSHTNVTINTLTNIQYRFNAGPWQPAIADDGAFNSTAEDYHFTSNSLSPGLHALQVAAFDSAGNVSAQYATATIAVLDPTDGGLNTELNPPGGARSVSQLSDISGVAYHMQGNIVTRVEYRLDNGPWQLAAAQDGAFDSDYETFTVPLDLPEPGTYWLEARAIDNTGYVEVNFTGQQLEVTNNSIYTTLLPIIVTGS